MEKCVCSQRLNYHFAICQSKIKDVKNPFLNPLQFRRCNRQKSVDCKIYLEYTLLGATLGQKGSFNDYVDKMRQVLNSRSNVHYCPRYVGPSNIHMTAAGKLRTFRWRSKKVKNSVHVVNERPHTIINLCELRFPS